MYAARQIRAKRCFFRSSDHRIAIWCHYSCTLQQCTGRVVDMKRRVLRHSWRRCGEGGAWAPCVFQRLRLGGKALDGELARLVPRGGPNQRSDRRRQPAASQRLPSRSAFAESRIPPSHHLPPSPSAPSVSTGGRFCSPATLFAKLPHILPCLISLEAMLMCGECRFLGSPHRNRPLECVQWVLMCGSLAETTLKWHNVSEPERITVKCTFWKLFAIA